MAKDWHAITLKKRKQLARRSVEKANGNTRSPAELGKARKIIEEIVKDDPTRYLDFHERYCTPKDAEIITETAKRLTPQLQLF